MLQVDIDKITSVTEARDNLNKIVEEVDNSDIMHVLTKNGTPVAVIVGVNHLEKLTGQPLTGSGAAASSSSNDDTADDDQKDEAKTETAPAVPEAPVSSSADMPANESKPASDLPEPLSFSTAADPKPADPTADLDKTDKPIAPASSLPGAVPPADTSAPTASGDDLFSDFDNETPTVGAASDNKSIFNDDELPTSGVPEAPATASLTSPAPSSTETSVPETPSIADPMVPGPTPEAPAVPENPAADMTETPLAATPPAIADEASVTAPKESSTLPVNSMNYNDFIAPPDSTGISNLSTVDPVPETITPPVADAMATPPVIDAPAPVVDDSQSSPVEVTTADVDAAPDVNPNLAHPNYSFEQDTPVAQPAADQAQ